MHELYRAARSPVGYLRMECATDNAGSLFDQKNLEDRLPFVESFHDHVSKGLTHLHEELKLVHLDVKPENVLYFAETDVFKLADFGFTIAVDSSPEEVLSMGTRGYILPDYFLIKHKKPNVGVVRDMWALAVCMHMILVNVLPIWEWDGATEKHWDKFFAKIKDIDWEDTGQPLCLPAFETDQEELKERFKRLYQEFVANSFLTLVP